MFVSHTHKEVMSFWWALSINGMMRNRMCTQAIQTSKKLLIAHIETGTNSYSS